MSGPDAHDDRFDTTDDDVASPVTGYDPCTIYPMRHDKSGMIRTNIYLPVWMRAQFETMREQHQLPIDYHSFSDFVRDAIVHRSHFLREHGMVPGHFGVMEQLNADLDREDLFDDSFGRALEKAERRYSLLATQFDRRGIEQLAAQLRFSVVHLPTPAAERINALLRRIDTWLRT